MIIKELKQTSPERYTLVFDDGCELKTTLSVVTDFYLHSGTELDGERYSELERSSSLALCKARALRIINSRAVSKKELRDKLTDKGEDAGNAELCVQWLCDMGLIDDRSYAGSIVRHYSSRGYGIGRIRQELHRHGIPAELWEEALSEMPEQDDKLSRFISARLTDPSDKAQLRKLYDDLYRRGYSWQQIKKALSDFSSEEDFQ